MPSPRETGTPASLLARAAPVLFDARDAPDVARRLADLLAEAGGSVEVRLEGLPPARAGPEPARAAPLLEVALPGGEGRLAWWPPRLPGDADAAASAGLAAMASAALDALSRTARARRALEAHETGRLLLSATALLAHAETPGEVSRAVLEAASKAFGASAGVVALLAPQEERLDVVLALGYPEEAVAAHRSFSLSAPLPLARAASLREPVLLGDAAAAVEAYPALADALRASRNQALAALPLVAEGRVVGALGLSFPEPRAFHAEERAFLEGLAGQCAQAIERARLLVAERAARAQAEAATRRLSLLLDASTLLSSPMAYDAALDALAGLAVRALGGTCTVYLREGDLLVAKAMRGDDPEVERKVREIQSRHRHDLRAEGGLAAVYRSGKPLLVPRVTEEMLDAAARDARHREDLRALRLASSMVLPLRVGGETAGVLAFSRAGEAPPYAPEDLALAEELARRAGLALENASLLKAAREAEARLDNLVRTVPGVVWEAGGEAGALDRVLFVSEHAEEMLGHPVGEWLSTPGFLLSIVHPDDRERAAREMAGHLARGGRGVHEFRWVAKDGRVLDVLTHCVALRDGEGRAVGLRGVSIDVTERKRAEDRLRLYHEVFLASRDAIAVIDPEGRYLEQNEAHRLLTGYHDVELQGRTPAIHMGEEPFAALAEELARSGQARGEYVSRRRDGESLYVDLSAFTVRDAMGRVAYHVGIKRDITRRRQVESDLRDRVREVEAVYRMTDHLARAEREDEAYAAALDCVADLLDAPRSAVCLYGEGGDPRVVAWRNLSAPFRAALERHAPPPRRGPDAAPLLVEDTEADERAQAWREAMRAEGVRAAALFPLVHQDRPVGVLAVYHDEARAFSRSEVRRGVTIASQVAFAVARMRAEDALRKSELWLRTVFDTLDEAVLVVDYPARIVRGANLALARVLGYDPAEVVGKSKRILHVDEASFAEYGRRIEEAFVRGEPARFEFPVRRKDGAVIPAAHTVLLLRGRDGALLGGLCVVRDLTEEKRALAELEGARRQVAITEKLSALGSLVSGVAHEIRTPLAYITNHLFLMEQRIGRAAAEESPDLAALHAEVARHGAAAMEGVERINRIVGELRRFTRLKAGDRAPAPLDLVVLEAVDLFRSAHRGRLEVTMDLEPTPEILLDRLQVQQVVLNLLDNAADATGRVGAVHVRTRPMPGGAEVSVADRGPGIPPEVQARMFDPLFTTKKDGTGLGLSIVRRIVESHGGSLRFETAPGEGTVFHVFFPEAAPEPPSNRPEALKPAPSTPEG